MIVDAAGYTKEQAQWTGLGYGLFIHFGPNTQQGIGWGDGTFPSKDFGIVANPDQWADVAAGAGMRYAVLTAKHHDGFCLWPSGLTEYSIKSSVTGQDIVGDFVTAFRKRGIRTGIYYSLWDRNFPEYGDDEAYAGYMMGQLGELLTWYGDMCEVWFDGSWDKDFPTGTWDYDLDGAPVDVKGELGRRWRWGSVYGLIKSLSPSTMVIMNSSSNRPGSVLYPPVDVCTAEHFDYLYNGVVCSPRGNPRYVHQTGGAMNLPIECCTSLNPSWFHTSDHYLHPSADTVASWYRRARGLGGNLLLNIGPNREGIIPEYHQPILLEARVKAGIL